MKPLFSYETRRRGNQYKSQYNYKYNTIRKPPTTLLFNQPMSGRPCLVGRDSTVFHSFVTLYLHPIYVRELLNRFSLEKRQLVFTQLWKLPTQRHRLVNLLHSLNWYSPLSYVKIINTNTSVFKRRLRCLTRSKLDIHEIFTIRDSYAVVIKTMESPLVF